MRAIPPLNTGKPVTGLPFFSITPAMLTYPVAPETPPAAYNGGTPYALNAESSVANAGADNALDVYRSLSAGNTGHAPASSPTWWQFIGTTYPVWSAGTYALGDRVLDATAHYEYLSLVGSNSAALTDATKWQLQGATNRFRMFDLMRNDVSTFPSGSKVEITPGVRIDSIGIVGISAKTVLIEVIVGGIVKWSRTETLKTRFTTGLYSYFFGRFTYRTKIVAFDLPPYSSATIRLTFTGTPGQNVAVSRVVVNQGVYIGKLLHDAESDALNFSTITRNDAGDSILVPKPTKQKIRGNIRINKTDVPRLTKLRSDLNAIPAIFSGIDDSASGYFEALVLCGIYKAFPIAMDKPEQALVPFEAEEV